MIEYFDNAAEPEYKACARCYSPMKGVDPHHKMKRSTGGGDDDIVFLCRECHNYVEENPQIAKEEGFHDGRYKMNGQVYGEQKDS